VELPGVEAGSVLVFPNVGAYGLTASLLGFLGHAAPAEVVLDGTRVVSATRLALRRDPLDPPQATAHDVREEPS
jgi:diaminopimelate decarboxylase